MMVIMFTLSLIQTIERLINGTEHSLGHVVAVRERVGRAALTSDLFLLVAKVVDHVEILERAIEPIQVVHGVVLVGACDYAGEDAIGWFAALQTLLEAAYVRVALLVGRLAVRDHDDEQLAFVVDQLQVVAQHLVESARERGVAARLIRPKYTQEFGRVADVSNLSKLL